MDRDNIGRTAGVPRAASPKATTFTDRVSTMAGRLSEVNHRAESILVRVRGSHPVAVDPEPSGEVPTLYSACAALERLITDLEGSLRELSEAF